MNDWIFVDNGCSSGSFNMEYDNSMIERFLNERIPIFRIYGWNPPSFSYGISQDIKEHIDTDKCKKNGIDIVKRMTGGGIIYHKDEITYSLVISLDMINEYKTIKDGYKYICGFIIEFYKMLELDAVFAVDNNKNDKVSGSLCFSSNEEYDIIINGMKIGGNAQKILRNNNILFQHGSIPVRDNGMDYELLCDIIYDNKEVDNQMNNSTSLKSLLNKELDIYYLKEQLKTAFISHFNANLI